MPLSVLLLSDDRPSHAPNVLEHISALRRLSRHRIDAFNPFGIGRSRLLRLDAYDVVVVHYTIFVLSDEYLAPWFREQIAAFGGLKVQFIQDEYRRVDAVSARARELGIDVLFSSAPAETVPHVYGPRLPGVDVLSTLTGYVPAELEQRSRPPLAGRPLDVVYRGRSIPYWLGKLGQEKVLIGRQFLERAGSTNLRCDIAWTESDRIYGDEWYRFIGSSRTTLGTESGASIVDFDGSLEQRTNDYLEAHPAATFEEVERELLAPYEGNVVIQTISPRVFEAAALGTAMVNFTGRYSDAIEPWVHYIPLEKDFSNFDEVVNAVRDDALLERIAARAHADLVASGDYSLQRFVDGFDREIEARARPARQRPRSVEAARRSLLGVEQLLGPSGRARVPVVGFLRARAARRTELRLLRRFPTIEALSGAAADAAPRGKLRYDLVRLAAAAAAHLRELRHVGKPFDVQIELSDDDRRLTLVGMREPIHDASERREVGQRVVASIRKGRLEEVIWNNSAVGSLTFLTVPLSRLEIGFHVVGGAHRFTALLDLARRDPDSVAAALEPLFRKRPDAPVDELDRRILALLRILSRPRETAALWAATVRAGLGAEDLRRLLRAYLGSRAARADAPIDLLFKDFFRLRLVGESPTSLELEQDDRTLVYRSGAGEPQSVVTLDAATVRSLERIVWDHSAVGTSVTSKEDRVSVMLEGGMHEFQALTPLARRFPELAVPALARAAGAP